MSAIFGMPVIVNPMCDNVQRITVSAEFARIQSPELVASTNAWMMQFFGVHDVAYIITDSFNHRKSIVVGPKAHAQLLMKRSTL